MYSSTHDRASGNMILLTAGSAFVALMVSASSVYYVPFVGPATGLGLLFLCWCTTMECALGVRINAWFGTFPIVAGVLAGLGVYVYVGVPFVRTTFFYWPRSRTLSWFHKFVTCSISSFLLVAGITYFAHNEHINMMSIARTEMTSNHTVCNKNVALISLLTWLGGFIVFLFVHTDKFDSWVFAKFRNSQDNSPASTKRKSVRKSVFYFPEEDPA